MSTPESIKLLRRANPRSRHDFAQIVATSTEQIGSLIDQPASVAPPPRRRIRRPVVAAVSAAIAAAIAFVVASSPEEVSASAAMKQAATATAASAEKSGTAVLRITHGGEVWAATTVRWHGDDVAISQPDRPERGMLVVGGVIYAIEDGDWVVLGPVSSIDPDSGTTPAEYLGAVREDVGGVTLRRLTGSMTGLTRSNRDDGSSVYSGEVAAGLIARETSFKGGQHIRVFPFGYVAHDEAANPRALLDAAVVVNADGVVNEITVTWGPAASAWRYTIAYSKLGETAALVAPANARPLRRAIG